mmetsp:Transcript_9051/g.18297  ORF Transcript_9051/g.18297 Transcript_9051/m.18297 type:complete len:536 (-) Transcript_9051:1350-2957(-)
MSGVQLLNANAQVSRRGLALYTTISAATGLQGVLKSNLGPRGTIKMLVSGAGDIKLTKDGNVLIKEMQIQNPTASMIAGTATAQDEMCGDGTTSTVLLIGELLRQAERYLSDGVHPRVIADGFDLARDELAQWMERAKVAKPVDRETLVDVARCSLATKVHPRIANNLAEIVTDAVLTIRRDAKADIDLHMVEIIAMEHQTEDDCRLVKGLVMDHGGRHPDMPKRLKDAYVLTCNVSLEYEKSEVNAGFFYSSAQQREAMVAAERQVVDERVNKIIALKKQVCGPSGEKDFIVINQKGIDPQSLDLLAREGILGLRRAKRRNMERLVLACGGTAVNSVDDLTSEVLGFAGSIYEQVLGEEKFTFVEEVENPFSCTILVKAPNKHTVLQIKDAIRDGLRAVKNTIFDACVLPGAGAFEVAASRHLVDFCNQGTDRTSGKTKLGVLAYAQALLIIPKTLAENSGFDAQESIIKIQEMQSKGTMAGLDLVTGDPIDPILIGVYDGVSVKKQMLGLSSVIATQLLLVDEVLKAGKDVNK